MKLLATLVVLPAVAGAAEPAAAARAHYQQAEQHSREGRWREAIGELTAAWRAKPHAELLFDLGKCHEALGEPAEALRYYRGYLRSVPGALDHEVVQQSIHELEATLRQRGEVVPEGAALRPVEVRRASDGLYASAFTATGLAGVFGLTGIIFGLSAQSGRTALVAQVYPQADVQRIHDSLQARMLASNVAYGVAAAAAVAAVVLFLLDWRARE